MKLPRDLAARDLIRALAALGYEEVRRTGSHIRVRTTRDGEHHETIPCHAPLKGGTLSAILRGVAEPHGLSRDELLELLRL